MAAAADFVEAQFRNGGWAESDVTRAVLATSEAAANAVEHACGGAFTVGYCQSGSEALVSVEDEGEGPDPAALYGSALPPDPLATSGRGLHIIRQLSDDAAVADGRLLMRFRPRG